MDCIVHGVAKSRTKLRNFHFTSSIKEETATTLNNLNENQSLCLRAKPLHSCPTFVTLCTVAHQTPLSIGLLRQEYWSRLPSPPPGDLPDPGIEFASLTSPALAGGFFTSSATWEAHQSHYAELKRQDTKECVYTVLFHLYQYLENKNIFYE